MCCSCCCCCCCTVVAAALLLLLLQQHNRPPGPDHLVPAATPHVHQVQCSTDPRGSAAGSPACSAALVHCCWHTWLCCCSALQLAPLITERFALPQQHLAHNTQPITWLCCSALRLAASGTSPCCTQHSALDTQHFARSSQPCCTRHCTARTTPFTVHLAHHPSLATWPTPLAVAPGT